MPRESGEPAQVADVDTNPPLVGTVDSDAATDINPMNYNYYELFILQNVITNRLYYAHTLLSFNHFLVCFYFSCKNSLFN